MQIFHYIYIYQIMMKAEKPLRKLFDDIYFAWQLLENEVKLETSDNIAGQDVSYLLQLYMRGVQKMNSQVDIRQSFFKNKVTSLMSRQSVIRILSKPMTKKKNTQQIQVCSPPQKIDNKKQLQLKQKRKQIEMRLAYGAQQNSPQVLKKMVAEHNQKQEIISQRIEKIIDTHEQRLANRIKQRKMRTMTAKSRSDIFHQHRQTNGIDKKEFLEQKRDEEQFGNCPIIEELIRRNSMHKEDTKGYRPWKSLQTKKIADQQEQNFIKVRKISVDIQILNKKKQNF